MSEAYVWNWDGVGDLAAHVLEHVDDEDGALSNLAIWDMLARYLSDVELSFKF